ncbi:hypothetical protein [Prescottella agglutinans]|uniref:ADP ribosyltransferase domain-containing protein n=1 Tax=Prescottella agglutinans TaxID=1644129 RepID=A0ABT6MJJ8_9NOCA|nr:hypothetical protein [Prescottella agglutinans]MDH6283986.1 hypothetical protein [Prescottella agglutinans]
MCKVGRRCFPHALSQLEAAEREAARCELVHADRLAASQRQAVSQAWIDQAADNADRTRRELAQRRIDYASTARGAHNLQLEAHAHEMCGQPEEAQAIRRTIARGLARRRAADTSDGDGSAGEWSPPPVRGNGSQCPECGQFTGAAHSCPPVLRDARRRALSSHATGPASSPGHSPAGAAAAGELSRVMYDGIPLDDRDADTIAAICADDRYGPALDLPPVPRRADGTIDTATAEFAEHRAAALERAKAACYEDEYINGIPVPIVLSQGALDPFAVPVKRDVSTRLGDQLADVPDSDLFDDDDRAALDGANNVQWAHTGHSLCWREDSSAPWREIVTGERADTRQLTAVAAQDARRLARHSVAAQSVSAWAAHTEHSPSAVGTEMQAAVRDVFVQPGGEASQSLPSRRARAIVRAQYALTQRELAASGVREVAVSRGMWFKTSQSTPDWVPAVKGQRVDAEVPMNAASSFTTRGDVAAYFARREWDDDEYVCIRVHGTVPAARILSTPRTGMGCLAEEEIVILGGPGRWEVERV